MAPVRVKGPKDTIGGVDRSRPLYVGGRRVSVAPPPESFAALGLAPGATPKQIRAAYLARARGLHPDNGGDASAFAVLNTAYLGALKYANSEPCPECDGAGSKLVMSGFHGDRKTCPVCDGSGQRHRDT